MKRPGFTPVFISYIAGGRPAISGPAAEVFNRVRHWSGDAAFEADELVAEVFAATRRPPKKP